MTGVPLMVRVMGPAPQSLGRAGHSGFVLTDRAQPFSEQSWDASRGAASGPAVTSDFLSPLPPWEVANSSV